MPHHNSESLEEFCAAKTSATQKENEVLQVVGQERMHLAASFLVERLDEGFLRGSVFARRNSLPRCTGGLDGDIICRDYQRAERDR